MLKTNEIYHGDALERLKEVEDKSIDLVIIDPPYIVNTSGAGFYNTKGITHNKELKRKGLADGFNTDILDLLTEKMKKINIYIFCSKKQIPFLLNYFVNEKNCNFELLSWHKSNPIPNCNNKYISDTEYCLFFREKGVKLYGNHKTKSTYYVTPLNQKDKKLYGHPTIKPLFIIENLITNSSLEGETVLDCFLGSGTTTLAAKRLNRNYIGIEKDEEYFEIAKKRMEEETI